MGTSASAHYGNVAIDGSGNRVRIDFVSTLLSQQEACASLDPFPLNSYGLLEILWIPSTPGTPQKLQVGLTRRNDSAGMPIF